MILLIRQLASLSHMVSIVFLTQRLWDNAMPSHPSYDTSVRRTITVVVVHKYVLKQYSKSYMKNNINVTFINLRVDSCCVKALNVKMPKYRLIHVDLTVKLVTPPGLQLVC